MTVLGQRATGDAVRIPAGTCAIGSDEHYAEEAPRRRVDVDEFWIDRFAVTNREYDAFVAATRYVTVAEHRSTWRTTPVHPRPTSFRAPWSSPAPPARSTCGT